MLKCLVAKTFFSLPCFSVHQLQFQFLSLLSLSLFATPGARLSLFAGIPSKLHARSKYRNLRASDTLTNPRFYQYLTHALSPCTSESGLLACEQALYLGDIVKRRRAGDTREERASRRGFAARSGVLASLASLAQLGGLAGRLLNTIHKGLLVWFSLEGETIFEGDGRRGRVDNAYKSLIIENITY